MSKFSMTVRRNRPLCYKLSVWLLGNAVITGSPSEQQSEHNTVSDEQKRHQHRRNEVHSTLQPRREPKAIQRRVGARASGEAQPADTKGL